MNSPPEQIILTPAAAAKRAGVSRPTINRALKSFELRGRRDNLNRWQIDPADLDYWARQRQSGRSEQCATTGHEQSMTTLSDQLEQARSDLAATRERLAAETARAGAAERARDQAEAERDCWRSMAERQQSLLEDKRPKERHGLLRRLLGR